MTDAVSVSVSNTPFSIVVDGTTREFVILDDCSAQVTITPVEVAVSVDQNDATLVTAGIQGPQGPAGSSEEEVLASQVDFQDNGSTIYRGEAQPGTATSAAAWRVRKLTINAEGDVSTLWADGDSNMDNIWDNRYSLSYS